MKQSFQIRLLMVKKEWLSIVFWLTFPLIGTILIVGVMNSFSEDAGVPIGIVIEEDGPLASALVEQLRSSDYIQTKLLTEAQALYQLEQHKLDSVFIIRKKYDENIYTGQSRVIKAYYTNQSYAYLPVLELVSSYAQEQASHGFLLEEVDRLLTEYNQIELFDEKTIINESVKRQQNKDLIQLQYELVDSKKIEDSSILPPLFLSIWTILTLLSTLFLFDWVVKERSETISVRWAFSTMPFSHYAIWQLIFYTVVIFLFDLMMLLYFHLIDYLAVLVMFRLTINSLAFWSAHITKNKQSYYLISLSITILAMMTSGAFIPLNHYVNSDFLLTQLHPLYAFLNGQLPVMACVILLTAVLLYALKGEKHHA